MPKSKCFIMCVLLLTAFFIVSCGGGGPKNFQEISLPDVGVSIKVGSECWMTVWPSDKSAFKSRLSHHPEYVFAPITCAKGIPDAETISRIPNWRFVGLKGEFDPTMSPFSPDYPKPDGLYFVNSMKGELINEYKRELPWPGAEGVEATVREYEETHGAGGFSDLWFAYTVTFNHNGNAMEFNMRIPSGPDPDDWHDLLWSSITELKLE